MELKMGGKSYTRNIDVIDGITSIRWTYKNQGSAPITVTDQHIINHLEEEVKLIYLLNIKH